MDPGHFTQPKRRFLDSLVMEGDLLSFLWYPGIPHYSKIVLTKHNPITTSSDIYYARFSVVSNRAGEESIFYLLSSYRPLKAQEPFMFL